MTLEICEALDYLTKTKNWDHITEILWKWQAKIMLWSIFADGVHCHCSLKEVL